MKLTANQRRALAGAGQADGHARLQQGPRPRDHALERKGLFGDALTETRRCGPGSPDAPTEGPQHLRRFVRQAKDQQNEQHPSIEITIRGPQSSGKSTIAATMRDMLAEADIAAAVVGNEEPKPDGKAIERLCDLRGGPRVVILTSTEDGQRRDMAIADAVLSVLKNNGVNAGEAMELAKTIMAAIERAERNRP